MVKIAINGAAGRMGRRLVALAHENDELELVGAIEQADHDHLGEDAGVVAGIGACGVKLSDELPGDAAVVIDFTIPAATRSILERCVAAGVGLVIGTTGLSDDDHAKIDQAAKRIAVLQAPNMSLGINLMLSLVGQVAERLGDDYDIEIVETHHRFKADAPSGTALALAQAICDATGRDIEKDVAHGRHGTNAKRRARELGMHAIRSGDVVGRHDVSYGTLGEQIAIGHTATNRDVFVHGALRAATWLAGRPAGRYGMADVLGIRA